MTKALRWRGQPAPGDAGPLAGLLINAAGRPASSDATVTGLLNGSAELRAFGAADTALAWRQRKGSTVVINGRPYRDLAPADYWSSS